MQTYAFRRNYGFGVTAQVAGEELDRIAKENEGVLTPSGVVQESRPRQAPLHPVFEWRDPVAAEQWREHQARNLIASVEIVAVAEEQPEAEETRRIAYVSVGTQKAGAGYVDSSKIVTDDDVRSKVLQDALSGLHAWRRRYHHLSELAEIFEAIDVTEAAIEAVAKPPMDPPAKSA